MTGVNSWISAGAVAGLSVLEGAGDLAFLGAPLVAADLVFGAITEYEGRERRGNGDGGGRREMGA